MAVRVHFSAAAAVRGVLSLRPAWRRGEEVTARLALPEGESNATIQTEASAAQVRLWWPNGLGRQHLYNLTVSFTPDVPPLPPTFGKAGVRAVLREAFFQSTRRSLDKAEATWVSVNPKRSSSDCWRNRLAVGAHVDGLPTKTVPSTMSPAGLN